MKRDDERPKAWVDAIDVPIVLLDLGASTLEWLFIYGSNKAPCTERERTE